MPPPRPVAPLLLVLLLSACEGLSVENGGPHLDKTCVVKADEPHRSTTSRRQEIVGKGWFTCSVPLQDGTLVVELQRRSGDGWETVEVRDQEVKPVPLRKKSLLPVPTPCTDGTFRTATRLSAHDVNGAFAQSPWYYSKSRIDPCGKR